MNKDQDKSYKIINSFSKLDNVGKRRYFVECECCCGTFFTKRRDGSAQTCGTCEPYSAKLKRKRKKLYDEDRVATARKSSAKSIYNITYKDGDISFEKFLELSQLNCYYCSTPPDGKFHKGIKQNGEAVIRKFCDANGFSYEAHGVFSDVPEAVFIYNGLDKIDQSKLHTLNNVVVCCKRCNWMKRDLSQSEFLQRVKEIYECIQSKI